MLCVNSILNQSLLHTGTLAVSKLGAETLQRLSLIATREEPDVLEQPRLIERVT